MEKAIGFTIPTIQGTIQARYNYSKFNQFVEDRRSVNESFSQNYSFRLRTNFREAPNVSLRYDYGVQDNDQGSTAVYTQLLAKEEGMFLGNSAGAAIKGVLQLKEHFKKDDVVVVLFHDHGSRYVGKMFNNEWMKKMGYID